MIITLLNTAMKNSGLIHAQQDYIAELTKYCTHGLTLQTTLHTCNASEQRIVAKTIAAQQAMRSFIPKLNRLLTGNGYKRNPQYLPIVVTALEGTLNNYDRNKTLHFHLALGNFDAARLTVDAFERLAMHWTCTGVGTEDIKLHTLRKTSGNGWGGYIHKEAWVGNADCIDLSNTQMPIHLLAN